MVLTLGSTIPTVAQNAERFRLKEGDVLIAMTGATVGKIGLMPRTSSSYFLNQRVGKFFSLKSFINNEFIFWTSITPYFQTKVVNLAQGAAQPNISGQSIESIQIIIPDETLINKFSNLCNPLRHQITTLRNKNVNLRTTRDLLLPKLISGEIDVADLDSKTDG